MAVTRSSILVGATAEPLRGCASFLDTEDDLLGVLVPEAVGHMARHDKTLLAILRGGSDANIGFHDLCGLLRHLGFEERVRGSHHIFFRSGIEELINVQRSGSNAKPYQVRQVRAVITRHGLGGGD